MPQVMVDAVGRPAPCFAGDPARDRSMLLLPCEIGGYALEMLVDTGAQTSVMSMTLMQQLNLSDVLDQTQQGMASGVGREMVIGRLQNVPAMVGHLQLGIDFSVLGGDEPLLLLGIDQMRKFQCVVDLDQHCLMFGGAFGGVQVPFLPTLPQHLDASSGLPQQLGTGGGVAACAIS
mmetsp:Transcript_123086/g.342821  ORF Transcript_123086/g.342821 Transcript_123086/m.342821 type:complete len:176 (-) Transcript_123086:53-580(-)